MPSGLGILVNDISKMEKPFFCALKWVLAYPPLQKLTLAIFLEDHHDQ